MSISFLVGNKQEVRSPFKLRENNANRSAYEKRQKEEETVSEQKSQELTRKANDVVITDLNECSRKGIRANATTDITRWKQNKEVTKSLQEKLSSFSRFGTRGKVQLNACKAFKFSSEGAYFTNIFFALVEGDMGGP